MPGWPSSPLETLFFRNRARVWVCACLQLLHRLPFKGTPPQAAVADQRDVAPYILPPTCGHAVLEGPLAEGEKKLTLKDTLTKYLNLSSLNPWP